jgi:formate hydrogenlyase subunit 4
LLYSRAASIGGDTIVNDLWGSSGTAYQLLQWLAYVASLILLPIITIGTIRKVKARLQNRIGPPLLQPVFDLIKLGKKGETLSETLTWIFRSSAAINLSNMLIIAGLVPWLCYKPVVPGADIFLIVYLFALSRMFTILAALDSASAFGAFGASREATISMLVEPATILSLVSIGVLAKTSDLNVIFSMANTTLTNQPGIWLLVGTAILLSSLVELSRMPVDDPTTHLELTMVHEAMILESSGKNLSLIEFAHALRMSVLFGLSAQCYMRAVPFLWHMNPLWQATVNVVTLLLIASGVGVFESVAVKLQWRKVPEFIAYCLTMSLLAGLIAVGGGIVR